MSALARWFVASLAGAGLLLGSLLAGAQQPTEDPYGPAPVSPPAAAPPAAPVAAPRPAPAPAATAPAAAPRPTPPPVPAAKAPAEAGHDIETDEDGSPVGEHPAAPGAGDEGHGEDAAHGPEPVAAHGEEPAAAHGEEPAAAHGEGPEAAHGEGPEAAHGEGPEAAHGEGHGGHHEAPGEINLAQGFLGESAEGPYGLLYRPVGAPPPLLALLFNTAVVFGVLYVFGRAPLQQALQQRRAAILKGMEEAAKMKAEAEIRLRVYEERLDHLDDELERLKREMREQAETERERILAEARTKRAKMEQEARRMVELELKAAREALQAMSVRNAVAAAREMLSRELGSPDHRRLVERHVADLQQTDLGGVS